MKRGMHDHSSKTVDSVAHEHRQLHQARKVRWPSMHEVKVKGTAKGHGQRAKTGGRGIF